MAAEEVGAALRRPQGQTGMTTNTQNSPPESPTEAAGQRPPEGGSAGGADAEPALLPRGRQAPARARSLWRCP